MHGRYISGAGFCHCEKYVKEGSMTLNKKLLEILICPRCRGKVRHDEKLQGIICDKCKLLYEIKDDIPVMLVEEAKKIS
jgi:uncharacterized protein YbaR (Trm112 family)